MKVIKCTKEEACARAAGAIAELVRGKSGCTLALSAAPDLMGVYDALASSGVDFSESQVFLTEEYLGQDVPEGCSRASILRERLFAPEKCRCGKFAAPETSGDLNENCAGYDALIAAAGGIDLAVLAIGVNGHIAFNEPLAAYDSGTHMTKLTDVTRREEWACEGSSAPSEGITVGIKTLAHARRVILVAFGEEKADAVHSAVDGRAHISVPASLMQLHDNVAVYLDSGAASLI